MRMKTKEDRRDRIKHRIRKRVRGTDGRPKLLVTTSPSLPSAPRAVNRARNSDGGRNRPSGPSGPSVGALTAVGM